MKLLRAVIFPVLLIGATGCVTTAHHRFEGLGADGDPRHPLSVSAGRFYKSSEGTWHYNSTSSSRFPNTTDWPFAFAIRSDQLDFDLQEFTVRDKNGTTLRFVKIAPAYEDYPESKQAGILALLVPQGSTSTEKKDVLATGVYHIEVTYKAGGELGYAKWTIDHSTKTDIDVWTMPRS